MGPPTISADQRALLSCVVSRPLRFNGAADDLGGSTPFAFASATMVWLLQWGRRRSRRINGLEGVPADGGN